MKKTLAFALAAATAFVACQPVEPEVTTPVGDGILPTWATSASIYEVNIRQYTPEGTLKAFETHLPRLAELGVDILWFMPIQPIGEENRKGDLGSYYSISDYTAVNPDFGTLEDFKAIVDKAHELGMHVILDWVANHTSFDHVWVNSHPDFYTHDSLGNYPIVAVDNDGNLTDWTDVADLNYDNAEMRDSMRAEMHWWMKNAGIDGFRCDVAGFVPNDFWNKTITSLREEYNDVFMLAEWEDPALIEAGFNAVYGWEFHHIMNEVAQGSKTMQAIADYAAKCDTVWPERTMKMYFTTNHDENSWNGTIEERMTDKGDAMFVIGLMMDRSFPLIYSGVESGLNHRYPFFSKDTIGVQWSETHQSGQFYRKLFELKENHAPLWNAQYGGEMTLEVDSSLNKLTILRELDGEKVAAVIDLSQEKFAVQLPGLKPVLRGPYFQIFTSEGH